MSGSHKVLGVPQSQFPKREVNSKPPPFREREVVRTIPRMSTAR